MTRGRPRKIDPETALKAAMKVFWEKGYDGTSMCDLVAATGMAKPGIYKYFGDKESLYGKALEHYFYDEGGPLLSDFKRAKGRLHDDVYEMLRMIADASFDNACPKGCFVVNSLVETADQGSHIEKITRKLEAERMEIFNNRFQVAQEKGDLPADCDAPALADFFAAQVSALAVKSRSGATREDLYRFIDVAMTALPTSV